MYRSAGKSEKRNRSFECRSTFKLSPICYSTTREKNIDKQQERGALSELAAFYKKTRRLFSMKAAKMVTSQQLIA